MTTPLSDELLARLNGFLAEQMGLHFTSPRRMDLLRGIQAAAKEFGFEEAEPCVRWLVSAPLTRHQTEILASYFTVGETYFFRDMASFDLLRQRVLPEVVRARRQSGDLRLRIWSAACATGEEPYSIAITLQQLIPDWRGWNITLRATDINPHFLQKAHEGVYTNWSFRNAPSWLKESYFTPAGEGRFELLPEIKRMVAFSHLNLATDAYPSLLTNTNAMDIIFCRNVLMYFEESQERKVIENLHHALVDGGWLFVSPSEASHVMFRQFATVNFPGAILYQKPPWPEQGEAAGEEAVALPPPAAPAVEMPRDPAPSNAAPGAGAEPSSQEPPRESLAHARDLYGRGHYAGAAEKLSSLLSLHPNDAKAISLLARTLANMGKLDDALAWCDRLVSADKLDPAGYYLKATVLQEKDDLAGAAAALRRALYLDADFALAHFALGNLAVRQGRSAEARRHLENALLLLRRLGRNHIIPLSEGITAGRLSEIIASLMESEALA